MAATSVNVPDLRIAVVGSALMAVSYTIGYRAVATV